MAKKERLSATPLKYLIVEGGEGWLYLWNNGDTQILWINRPADDPIATGDPGQTQTKDEET